MQESQRTILTEALVTIGVLIVIAAILALSIELDKREERKINTYGGYVGVVNNTEHKVTLHLFRHKDTGVVDICHTIAPKDHWIIRDSMSATQVSNFPPYHWLDSAYLIFDDTLLVRHVVKDPLDIRYKDHLIIDKSQWMYDSPVVRHGGHGRTPLYRPTRIYTITDKDYKKK